MRGFVKTVVLLAILAVSLPVYGEGYLKVSSDPSGATVYIDGSSKGATPIVVELRSGNHEVRITKPNFVSKTLSVSIRDSIVEKVHFNLVKGKGWSEVSGSTETLTAEKGNLTFLTPHDGIRISIDGVSTSGTAPMTLNGIDAGSHDLSFSYAGRSYQKSIHIPAKETLMVKFENEQITVVEKKPPPSLMLNFSDPHNYIERSGYLEGVHFKGALSSAYSNMQGNIFYFFVNGRKAFEIYSIQVVGDPGKLYLVDEVVSAGGKRFRIRDAGMSSLSTRETKYWKKFKTLNIRITIE